MTESPSHKRAKSRAAGPKGRTEVPLKGGKRLDAKSPGRATEIERSGLPELLVEAALRLKRSGAPQKVLQVPQKDMSEAVKAMKIQGIGGTVKNMGGTKSAHVRKK